MPYGNGLAGRERHRVRIRVDRLDARLEPELDELLLVLLGRVDDRVLRRHLAAQDELREWRAVVGRVRLGGEDRDERLAACLAVGVDEARGRAAAADDDDGVLCRHLSERTPTPSWPHLARIRSSFVARDGMRDVRLFEPGDVCRPSARARAAASASSTCSGFVAPTIGAVTPGRPSTHASATWAGGTPRPAATSADPVDDVEVRVDVERVGERIGA